MHNAQKCPKMSMLGNLWTLTCFKKKRKFFLPKYGKTSMYYLVKKARNTKTPLYCDNQAALAWLKRVEITA